jgi:hypothetical protein
MEKMQGMLFYPGGEPCIQNKMLGPPGPACTLRHSQDPPAVLRPQEWRPQQQATAHGGFTVWRLLTAAYLSFNMLLDPRRKRRALISA